MKTDLKIPPLGENVDQADVLKVLVRPGDRVTEGQVVLELETGKATVEVPATASGIVAEIRVAPGDKVTVGQVVLLLDSAAAAPTPASDSGSSSPRHSPSPSAEVPPDSQALPSPASAETDSTPAGPETTYQVPTLGENVDEADVVKVLVQPGSEIRAGQPILEIETGKATAEVPSPGDGIVTAVLVQVGQKIRPGDSVLRWRPGSVTAAGGAARPTPPPAAPTAEPAPAQLPKAEPVAAPLAPAPEPEPQVAIAAPSAESHTPVPAAPSVRRFAREIGVDITQVKGSGPRGRITIEDVKRHARQMNTGRVVRAHCALEAEPLPDFSRWGPVQRETMTTIRVVTAEHLSRAWATIPHVTQHDRADVTELEELRKRFAPRAEAAGGRLTLTAILLKIAAAALKVHPKFNASVDLPGRAIIYKKYYHIGVAVDTPRGLIVPVICNVDQKNLIQLSVELTQIAQRAREGKITPDELTGGTFTITNLGGIGGSFFTPIIHAPEVAILGVGRATYEMVCGPDRVCQPRLMLPLSLSYDHRLIDGADGARFLRWIVEALQEPLLVTLEG